MSQQQDLQIEAELRSGMTPAEVAARYNVSEAYVERASENANRLEARRFDWSFNPWGNRLVYSIAAGFVINLATGINAIGVIVAVVLFVLTTAIVVVRRS